MAFGRFWPFPKTRFGPGTSETGPNRVFAAETQQLYGKRVTWVHLAGAQPTLRISFDDISFCRYRVIFKISLKYRYRIFFGHITRYLIMKYWSILAFHGPVKA